MSKDLNYIRTSILKAKFTDEQVREAREAFQMYDTDADDTITTTELIPALRALGYNSNQVILEKIKEMDLESDDGVGKLSFDGFLDFIVMHIRYSFTCADMMEDFKLIDVNNDGKITKFELKGYLESLKIPFSDEELDEIVNAADLNNDGSIDYKEFVIMMSPDQSRCNIFSRWLIAQFTMSAKITQFFLPCEKNLRNKLHKRRNFENGMRIKFLSIKRFFLF